jgi:hypothetical protein
LKLVKSRDDQRNRHFQKSGHMNASIHLTMFQCMLFYKEMKDEDIRDVWKKLNKDKSPYITHMHACPPGALAIRLDESSIDKFKIGSIHLKLDYNTIKLSIILFSNMKMKFSGGLQRLEHFSPTIDFWNFVKGTIIQPCVGLFFENAITGEFVSGMVNASCKLGEKLVFGTFLKKIDKVKGLSAKQITLPKCLTTPGARGRICSLKIKRNDMKGTLIFDHHLSLQAFGYRDLDHMSQDISELKNMFM